MKLEEVLISKINDDTEANRALLSQAAKLTGHQYIALGGAVYNIQGGMMFVGALANLMEDRSSMALPPPVPTFMATALRSKVFIMDDFYAAPDGVRAAALASELVEHPERHKGARSSDFEIPPEVKTQFERLTGPMGHGYSCWQLNVGGETIVYHSDTQRWAGAVYLTPDAPPDAGTSFWRSRTAPRVRSSNDLRIIVDGTVIVDEKHAEVLVYGGALLDRTRWQEVDRVGNVYNRLVVWDAKLVHSVSEYFGHNLDDGRLTQLFFWDDEIG